MKAYMIIYPTESPARNLLRRAMNNLRQVEHISPNCSVVLTFRSEEEILDILRNYNEEKIPLFIFEIPGRIYTENVGTDYMEPHSMEHL